MTPSARPTYSSGGASQADRRLFLSNQHEARLHCHGIDRALSPELAPAPDER
jgi:hypothetical protein